MGIRGQTHERSYPVRTDESLIAKLARPDLPTPTASEHRDKGVTVVAGWLLPDTFEGRPQMQGLRKDSCSIVTAETKISLASNRYVQSIGGSTPDTSTMGIGANTPFIILALAFGFFFWGVYQVVASHLRSRPSNRRTGTAVFYADRERIISDTLSLEEGLRRLLQAHGGWARQRELVIARTWSAAMVNRSLATMEARGTIERRQLGEMTVVYLSHTIESAAHD